MSTQATINDLQNLSGDEGRNYCDIHSRGRHRSRERRSRFLTNTFEFLCHVLVIVIGLTVYQASGLQDAMGSTLGRIGLGAAVVYWHVFMFRLGYYTR